MAESGSVTPLPEHRERSRSHPGWFGGVMGTAALSVAAFRIPTEAGLVNVASLIVGWTFLIFACMGLLALVVINLIHHTPRGLLLRDVRSPRRGPAYAAVPGAVLTLLLAFEAALPDMLDGPAAAWSLLIVALAAAAVDVWLTLVFFTSVIAHRGSVQTYELSGVWFMPQTVLLIAATALARLSITPHGNIAEIAAPISVLLIGAGFLLFIFVGALVLGHLVSHALAPEVGIPAAWIMMSPAAASALAFMALPTVIPTLMTAPPMSVSFVTSLMAGALVGFSLWWLAVVGVLTFQLRREAMMFSPSSWSYVFPLGAVAVASGELARTWQSSLMIGVAIVMAVLGTAVWLVVFIESVPWIRARLASQVRPGE
jgi:tellurite resistance protein TehA-like permease